MKALKKIFQCYTNSSEFNSCVEVSTACTNFDFNCENILYDTIYLHILFSLDFCMEKTPAHFWHHYDIVITDYTNNRILFVFCCQLRILQNIHACTLYMLCRLISVMSCQLFFYNLAKLCFKFSNFITYFGWASMLTVTLTTTLQIPNRCIEAAKIGTKASVWPNSILNYFTCFKAHDSLKIVLSLNL